MIKPDHLLNTYPLTKLIVFNYFIIIIFYLLIQKIKNQKDS